MRAFQRWMGRIHYWAGLILALQIVLWMASGVVMSWFQLSLVRGEHALAPPPPSALPSLEAAAPALAAAQNMGPIISAEIRSWLDRTVIEVTRPEGARALYDLQTAQPLSPLSRENAERVANADFTGPEPIEQLALMDTPPHEYRGSRPVWRADFADGLHTRLYISPETGEVVARRNWVWRFYDFFWMLHIMDYQERENFNNPLIKGAALAGLVFTLSGVALLFFRWRRYAAEIGKSGHRP